MKRIFTLLVLLICSVVDSNAQDPSHKRTNSKRNNLITLNPGTLVQNYIYPVYNLSNTSQEYLVVYHRLFKKSNGIRLGVNFNSRKDNVTQLTPTPNIYNQSLMKVGLGYERFFYITKNWNYFIGADLQYEMNDRNYENYAGTGAFNKNKTKERTQAVYPFIGLQAKLNASISITLLSGVKAGSTTTDTKGSYQSTPTGPVTNLNNNGTSTLLNYVQPSLAINFRL